MNTRKLRFDGTGDTRHPKILAQRGSERAMEPDDMEKGRRMVRSDLPKILLKVEEAAPLLGIGRTQLFALIRTGEVRSVCVGRLRRLRYGDLVAYAERLACQTNTQRAA